MDVQDSFWDRLLLYVSCGAITWGAMAVLEPVVDWLVTGASVLAGALVGLCFAMVSYGRQLLLR